MKPKMPEKRPFIRIPNMKANLMMDTARYSSGSLCMSFERVKISETQGHVKTDLGWIDLCIGGGVVIHDERTKRTYGIDPKEIWLAYDKVKDEEVDPNGFPTGQPNRDRSDVRPVRVRRKDRGARGGV